jgi:hypothetical protein
MPESLSTTILARLRNAVSSPAEELDKKLAAVLAAAQQSRALFGTRSDAISAIWSVASEAAEDDWNGEGAFGVDPVAASNAVGFIQTLPDSVAMPEISPDPDGALSLDWIESRTRAFSISVGRNRSLAFAWLDGTARGYGVVSFDGEDVPTRVLDEVSKIRIDGVSFLRVA